MEPQGLLMYFLKHPPQGFSSGVTAHGVPWFVATLDLLTTLDERLRRRVRSWWIHRLLGPLLRWRTLFIGSTVTEYLPLPGGLTADELVAELHTRRHARRLLIVKDIPADDALIGTQALARAQHCCDALRHAGFVLLQGQALAWVAIDFSSQAHYLERLSSARRKNIRRKLRDAAGLDIRCLPTGCAWLSDERVRRTLYDLYLKVYRQSETQFDLLSPLFFDAVFQDAGSAGHLFVYRDGDHIVGWNLCYEYAGALVDKYIGLDYPRSRELNLYVVSWMNNLEFARARGLRHYIAGWTDPQIKSELGAQFAFTRHAVYTRNPLLRWLLRRMAGVFEGDRRWFETHAHDATRS